MDDRESTYFPPGDVAKRLDVSPSGLRRYASFYEEMYGELPKDNQGRRMWTGESVERLEAAKAIVASGQVSSIKDALGAVARGAQAPAEALGTPVPTNVLRVMMEEIISLRTRLDGLDRLEAEMQAVRRQLEAPKDDSRERELMAQVADLEQRNRAMLGELERRRIEGEQEQTTVSWWRRWFGR